LPDHDQHFKQLLQTCFGDLVRIVAPRVAPKLRLERPTFLESELFTDLPDGEHRRLDRYLAFGLSPSQAADYLKRPEPLAWALAALMRHRGLSAAQHRLACLRPAAAAKIDDARKFLLLNFVETYVQLDDSEQEEYESLLRDERNREVATMAELTLTTNADRLAHKHYVEGLEKGRELGEREGREHGQRELLLHLLTRRFGPLSEATRQRIQALNSSEQLSRLAERVLDAPSLDDLGL
jgi:hypothetical protein